MRLTPPATLRKSPNPFVVRGSGASRVDNPVWREVAQAIGEHVHWRLDVERAANGEISVVDPDTAGRNDMCALGRWLVDHGTDDERLERIKQLHETLHLRAADVLRQARAGDAGGGAASAMDAKDGVTTTSHALVSALRAWLRDIHER